MSKWKRTKIYCSGATGQGLEEERLTLWEEFLDNPVAAAEHSPRQVTVEAVAVLLDEAVNIVGDRTCIMSDSVKKRL